MAEYAAEPPGTKEAAAVTCELNEGGYYRKGANTSALVADG